MAKAGNGLQNFLSLVKSENLARSNRFEVRFDLPGIMPTHQTSRGNSARVVSMLAEDVIFPGLLIGTRNIRLNNVNYPRATFLDHGGDSLTVTFLCDDAWVVKDMFGDWMRKIVDPITREISFPDDYVSDMYISALNEQDEVIANWHLYGVFPRSIAPIQASATNSQVLRMPVTFTYVAWTVDGAYTPEGERYTGDPPIDNWDTNENMQDQNLGSDMLNSDPEIAELGTLEQNFDEEFGNT